MTGPARADEDSVLLEGNGAGLIRARALASAVQVSLERLYRLDRVADVQPFMRTSDDGREALLIREAEDGALEIALVVAPLGPKEADLVSGDIDALCQLIEGVSHFVYLSNRADIGREATVLEMELQAEVDKWVVLGSSLPKFDVAASAQLRTRLYEQVSYSHDASTELGERYRLANVAALGFVRSLEQRYLASQRYGELQDALRSFFRHGQEDKIRLSR